MALLMPLPLTVSCFSKIQIGFTFLVSAHPGSPGKRAVKRVCACVIEMAFQRQTHVGPKNPAFDRAHDPPQKRAFLTAGTYWATGPP